MKLNRVVVVLAFLLPFTISTRAQNESLASIFTNVTSSNNHTVIPRRSSIIFIACHGLAWGDLSCYGQTNFQTPNLDLLAAEGTRFTDYRATSEDLAAAQAALMAGNNAGFGTNHITLAARLRLNGYHTGLMGEWVLGPQPSSQGFDEFLGFLDEQEARNYYSDFIWHYVPGLGTTRREEIYDNTRPEKGKYMPDLLMGAMNNFIRVNQPDAANHYLPFFLLVTVPAPESVTPDKDEYPVPTDAPFTDEKWPQAAKDHAALVTRLDNDMGRLFGQLSQSGMSNNVVIFLAGETAPERFANTNLNFLKAPGEVRGGDSPDRLRVPMIVCWPGHVSAGRISSEPWSAQDFAPTALQIAYVRPAADFAGHSILPVLLDKQVTNRPASPGGGGRP